MTAMAPSSSYAAAHHHHHHHLPGNTKNTSTITKRTMTQPPRSGSVATKSSPHHTTPQTGAGVSDKSWKNFSGMVTGNNTKNIDYNNTGSSRCPRQWLFRVASKRSTVTCGSNLNSNSNDNDINNNQSNSPSATTTTTTPISATQLLEGLSGSPSLHHLSMSSAGGVGSDIAKRYTRERRSSIISIGLSVHTAPVEMREKLAVPEDRWEDAVRQLTSYPHIEEAGILSTCNRLELYAVAYSWNRGVREIEEWLAQSGGFELDDLRPYLFLLRDRDAVQHLLRVSGGLDSLVLGEGQILAQVKNVARLGEG